MDNLLKKLPPEILRRIWIKKETGCWIWIKEINKYARLKYEGKSWLVHRLIYTLLVGDFPEGHEASHVCRNKRCCRPHSNHVIPETRIQNLKRDHPYFDQAFRDLRQKRILEKKQKRILEKEEKKKLPKLCKAGHLMETKDLLSGRSSCKKCHSLRTLRRYHSRKFKREKEI